MDFLDEATRFAILDVTTGTPLRSLSSAGGLVETLRAEAAEYPEHLQTLRIVSFNAEGSRLHTLPAQELLQAVGFEESPF